MKFLATIVAAIVVGLASTKIYAGDYDFMPGLWETTSQTEIIGISERIPPHTKRECIKGTDSLFVSDNECKYEKKRVNAKKILVNITCTRPEGISKGTAEVNFNGKTSSGWFDMEIPQGLSEPMKMKTTFNGKQLGACE